ncbi:hypothetical protein AABB24_033737 [Solanum stoloniferum]|uniref:Uncharacterized protein n=1 Tax=Solanum stoloniferum TaxID=62892 RepID=A0ABD2RCY2_9SOLN
MGEQFTPTRNNGSCQCQLNNATGQTLNANRDWLVSIMKVAMDCCAKSPKERIDMKDVVGRLKKIKPNLLLNSFMLRIQGRSYSHSRDTFRRKITLYVYLKLDTLDKSYAFGGVVMGVHLNEGVLGLNLK